jgi:hypothetical protein
MLSAFSNLHINNQPQPPQHAHSYEKTQESRWVVECFQIMVLSAFSNLHISN